MYRTSAVVDVRLSLDFSGLASICSSIKTNFLKMPEYHADFEIWRNQTVVELHLLCQEPVFHLAEKDKSRHKRSPFLIAAGVGLFFSLVASKLFSSSSHSMEVNDHNIKMLDEQVQNLQVFSRKLAAAVERNKKDSTREFRLLQFQGQLSRVSSFVGRVSRGIINLLHGFLSQEILSLAQASSLMEDLTEVAVQQKARLPFSDHLSLYLFPVKHVRNKGHIDFFISIPLVQETFSLYRFLNFPIAFSGKRGSVFLKAKPDHEFLARRDGSNDVVVMTETDLQHCALWENDAFCSYLPAEQEDVCLQDLFQSPGKGAKSCDFELPHFESHLLSHLDDNQFLLSLNVSSVHVEEKCPNETSFFTLERGQHILQVTPGCSLHSGLFHVPAFTPIQKSAGIRFSVFPAIIEDLPANEKEIEDMSSFFSMLEHRSLMEKIPTWKSQVVTGIIIIAIVGIGLEILRRCFQSRQG